MFSIIIVAKNGELSMININEINNLFKKIGYKSADDFEVKYVWNWNNNSTKQQYKLELWAKQKIGKKNDKNQYNFCINKTPPIQFYGKCAILCFNLLTNKYCPLTIEMWNEYFNNYILQNNTSNFIENPINSNNINNEDEDENNEDDDDKNSIISDVSSSTQKTSTSTLSKKEKKEAKNKQNKLFDGILFPVFNSNVCREEYIKF